MKKTNQGEVFVKYSSSQNIDQFKSQEWEDTPYRCVFHGSIRLFMLTP